MSFVTTQPEALTGAAGLLHGIGVAFAARNAAAVPTLGVVPAAADEVSTLTATQFGAHAAMYQTVSAQAVAVHDFFVHMLDLSATSYAGTEAANTTAAG
jgi:hypothetical protein